MTFPVTCAVTSSKQRHARPPALILLSRLLLVVGGLLVFGIFAIMLAGNANAAGARAASATAPSRVDNSSTRGLTAPSLVAGVAGLTAPLIPTVHAVATSVAPAVAPVLKPVLIPVSVALAPSLQTLSALVAPVTQPVLDATAPLGRPATTDLGLAPALSAIGGSGTSVRTGPTAPVATPVSIAPVQAAPAMMTPADPSTIVAPPGASVNTVGSDGKTIGAGFFPAPLPRGNPGWPWQSLAPGFGVSACTSSASSGGGHSPGFGTADGAATALAHVSGSTLSSAGVLSPQPGYVHGRDHPS